jgi:hypothetical protein
MEMTSVHIIGRYISQVEKLTHEISIDRFLNWKTVNNPCEANIIIFFDILNTKFINLPAKKVLVRQEPEIVLPENYKLKNTANFWKIINVGGKSDGVELTVNWPQDINIDLQLMNEKQIGRTVLLNSNLISLHRLEMYSLRRHAAYELKEIDLFGYSWNNSILERVKALILELRKYLNKPHKIRLSGLKYYFRTQKNYLGEVAIKRAVMQKYYKALIIENSLTYVSEKIFDAFSAGCIPIYIGPNLKDYGIPNDLYIQAKPNLESIHESIKLADKIDYKVWFKHLDTWLKSDACSMEWGEKTYLYRIKKLIDD